MAIFFFLFVFILGSAIGSFLGVIVDRLSSDESIWKGRSRCDHCRHVLNALDLIPIISFFILKRKCRYCHKKLGLFYPLIEFTTGFSYVVTAYTVLTVYGQSFVQPQYILLLLYYFLLIGALLVIFFADVRYGIIPFYAVVVSFFITTLWYLLPLLLQSTPFEGQNVGLQMNFLSIIFSSLGAGGFFLLLFVLTKGRGIGFGDVMYVFLMGFILGFPRVILGLYLAFVTGAIISLSLVALKKKKFKGGTIPFGPFLVFGTIVSLLYGNTLLSFITRYLTF